MPLSESEKAVTRTILSYLTEEETFFLAETVSQRIVQAQTLIEAEDVVLQFSNDFEQLLKRQKMKREYLLRFIMENRLPNRDNRDFINAEKRTLIREILDFTSGGGNVAVTTTTTTSTDAASSTTSTNNVQNIDSSSSSSTTAAALDAGSMALLFAKWFYAMFNAFPQQRRLLMANPSTMSPDDSNLFGPHHFVENCCLNLRMRNSPGGASTNASCHAETVTGGSAVAERLAKLSVEDEIVFNANLDDEGCKGKKEPHGLVMIQISGTLMRHGCLIGVFDQSFGLIKEPQTDKWKVQLTNLAIQAGPGSGQSVGTNHGTGQELRSITG